MKLPCNGVLLRQVLALAVLLGGGLTGCSLPGTSAPTATPPPTATAAPATATVARVVGTPATPTVVPSPTATATAVPTATATVPPATPATPARPGTPETPGTPATGGATPVVPATGEARVVQDAAQVCEMSIPASLASTATPGTFASADGRVLVALQSLAVGEGETLDDQALPFVGAFIPTVEGYQQTAVIRLADNLRIDFTGSLPGRGNGTLYFHQFGSTVCVVTFFAGEGATVEYDALFEAMIATLRPKGVGWGVRWL